MVMKVKILKFKKKEKIALAVALVCTQHAYEGV